MYLNEVLNILYLSVLAWRKIKNHLPEAAILPERVFRL